MGKTDYLDALRRAMTGLPPETQAKTLAYYEQRFIDGVAAGRSEADVAGELDDPKKIAMTLRASAHLHSFEQKKNPANALRVAVSAVGLAIFNLFMVVPAMVYAALLAALYCCALAFYVAGIAVTASGLSGANELSLSGPLSKLGIITDMDDSDLQTKVSISTRGVELFQEKVPEGMNDKQRERARAQIQQAAREAVAAAHEAGAAAGDAAAAAAQAAIAADLADIASDAAEQAEQADTPGRGARVIRRAESMAERGIHVTTEMEPGSRATQTVFGLGMVLGGIILFLLSLVVTKYTLVGVKRYIEMNYSLLKGN